MKLVRDIHFLKQKSKEVITEQEAQEIITELEESLDLKKGIGLCAVQIGIAKRVSIIRIKDFKLDLINPTILEKDQRFRVKREGCLSLPGLYIDTARYQYVTFENGFDKKRYMADGLQSVAIQHEIDHMNGLTILDRKWRKRN